MITTPGGYAAAQAWLTTLQVAATAVPTGVSPNILCMGATRIIWANAMIVLVQASITQYANTHAV
jgi:hypothetical protein